MPLFIGTAGWAIPAAVRDAFPRKGTALQRYAGVMGCVEVNSSFHRPHRRSTWKRWADSVPEDFRFAVKIPKSISHVLRLVDTRVELSGFIEEVTGLGDRLAILLLQLPPSFVFGADVVADFLAVVRSLADVRLVIEPRHPSWFEAVADGLLASLGIARVAADPARVPAAAIAGGWRGITYVRLHGSPVMYRSSYNESRLSTYATMLAGEVTAGRPTWCMFDNTASSAALGDALQLQRFMEAGT